MHVTNNLAKLSNLLNIRPNLDYSVDVLSFTINKKLILKNILLSKVKLSNPASLLLKFLLGLISLFKKTTIFQSRREILEKTMIGLVGKGLSIRTLQRAERELIGHGIISRVSMSFKNKSHWRVNFKALKELGIIIKDVLLNRVVESFLGRCINSYNKYNNGLLFNNNLNSSYIGENESNIFCSIWNYEKERLKKKGHYPPTRFRSKWLDEQNAVALSGFSEYREHIGSLAKRGKFSEWLKSKVEIYKTREDDERVKEYLPLCSQWFEHNIKNKIYSESEVKVFIYHAADIFDILRLVDRPFYCGWHFAVFPLVHRLSQGYSPNLLKRFANIIRDNPTKYGSESSTDVANAFSKSNLEDLLCRGNAK